MIGKAKQTTIKLFSLSMLFGAVDNHKHNKY